jgi:hypothetical protein
MRRAPPRPRRPRRRIDRSAAGRRRPASCRPFFMPVARRPSANRSAPRRDMHVRRRARVTTLRDQDALAAAGIPRYSSHDASHGHHGPPRRRGAPSRDTSGIRRGRRVPTGMSNRIVDRGPTGVPGGTASVGCGRAPPRRRTWREWPGFRARRCAALQGPRGTPAPGTVSLQTGAACHARGLPTAQGSLLRSTDPMADGQRLTASGSEPRAHDWRRATGDGRRATDRHG